VVGTIVANQLNTVKTVGVPKAYGSVFTDSDDLLLLGITVNRNYLTIVVSNNAVYDPKSIRVNQDKSAFSAACSHQPELG
jgi:hypothetical protein